MNDSNEKLQEYEIVSNGSLSGGGELYTIAGDARTCYICGNQCEVMQSMMHAYTEIQVCGDCMFEHLYPFIETVKKIESEVKRDYFDAWATLALYSTLDQKEPHKPVRIKPTALLELLRFTKVVADAEAGYESFPTQNYRMIEESLHRLRTVEVTLTWSKTEKKKGKVGRPKKLTFEKHTSVLWSYTYVYEDEEGEFAGEQLPLDEQANVNEALTLDNEPGPPIYRSDRRRYKELEYRISDDLIAGLRGAEGGIGYTPAPLRIFELRPKLQHNPTATKLLVWSLRQVRPEGEPIKIDIDKLVKFAGLKGRNASRNRDAIVNSLGLLQEYGVLEHLSYERKSNQVSFFRSKQWQLGGPSEAQEEGKDTDII